MTLIYVNEIEASTKELVHFIMLICPHFLYQLLDYTPYPIVA